MNPISMETDLGTQLVVAAVLAPAGRVVDNPPNSLGNGDEVRGEGASHAD
jgi:hypothetical protein